jgi:hypothetical protein
MTLSEQKIREIIEVGTPVGLYEKKRALVLTPDRTDQEIVKAILQYLNMWTIRSTRPCKGPCPAITPLCRG